jgi:putative transposase
VPPQDQMPQSFTCLHYHLIFSTKKRVPLITIEIQSRHYEYLGGILRTNKGSLLAAGGMPDHVHLLAQLDKGMSVSEAMRLLKANSSKWIHDTFPAHHAFAWQSGYAAFSVSLSSLPAVKKVPGRSGGTPSEDDFPGGAARAFATPSHRVR